jgi:hypothetical protein
MLWKDRSRVIVWDSPALVYVRVPKSANTSLRKAFPGGVQHRLDLRRLATRFPGHLHFSFVRNPWARLVSVYGQKLRPEPVNEGPYVDGVHHCFVRHGLPVRAGMPFEEFAEFACSLDDDQTEKHLKSQCCFLVRDGALAPSFLGRVETLAEDWRRLGAIAGFDTSLLRYNRSQHAPYSSYFDRRLAQRVGDRYRADVETFGYHFEAGSPVQVASRPR